MFWRKNYLPYIQRPKNYRGITLINIMSTIFSEVIINRLAKWCTKHQILIDNQYGFQKGKSTTDCIFVLHSIIAKTLSCNTKIYCAFGDFEKCVDTINHYYLFHKLNYKYQICKCCNIYLFHRRSMCTT